MLLSIREFFRFYKYCKLYIKPTEDQIYKLKLINKLKQNTITSY